MISLKERLDIRIFDLNFPELLDHFKLKKNEKILFITDMIRTGESFITCYKQLTLNVLKENITFYSVLTTSLTNTNSSIRNIRIDNKDIEINCLFKVEQNLIPSSECELCSLGIPETKKDDENYDMYSSFDYWELCKLAGYKDDENDVPSHRDSIGKVCDYSNMIIQNGSWITFKLEKLLESYKIPRNDLVFVGPDESMPKVFSNYLRLLLSSKVIKIPRVVLDKIYKEKNNINKILESFIHTNPSWHLELSSLVAKDVIIIDEFNVSCGTFKTLYRLLTHYGHYVICFLPLIDFAPKESAKLQVPTYSLYSFQL